MQTELRSYRKKPVVIKAVQFDPSVHPWADGVEATHDPRYPQGYIIQTLENVHEVTPGDWIVLGVKGERYPVKPDIFEMTYEEVDGTPEELMERRGRWLGGGQVINIETRGDRAC